MRKNWYWLGRLSYHGGRSILYKPRDRCDVSRPLPKNCKLQPSNAHRWRTKNANRCHSVCLQPGRQHISIRHKGYHTDTCITRCAYGNTCPPGRRKNWIITQPYTRVFGAAGIMVLCDTVEEMLALAEGLEGQLTTTLHMEAGDINLAKLMPMLEKTLVALLPMGFNRVEVSSAMMHGGPYPASTDTHATSVGTLAISRWLRPVSYKTFLRLYYQTISNQHEFRHFQNPAGFIVFLLCAKSLFQIFICVTSA